MTYKGCAACQHFRPASGVCAAFPQGIPLAILSGQVEHTKPLPALGQDNDVVYTEVDNVDDWTARGMPEEERTR